MFASRTPIRTRIATTALLMGLSLAAACGDTPTGATGGNGGGTPKPQPTTPASVASVQVAPDTLTVLAVGGHHRVEATARAAGGALLEGRTVAWTSSDVAIAVVDASGNVTGVQPGRAWITATIDGKTAQARVDVLPLAVDSIAFAAPSVEVPWATARSLGATLYAADGRVLYDRTITWTSSDPGVATVDAEGRISGTAGGRAWITATSEGNTARAEVIVPLVKTMTLATARGEALPVLLRDTIYDDGEGRRRRVRTEATEGRLSMHSRSGAYAQRVVLRTSERSGTCTDWGSCIWDVEPRVTERVVNDRGTMEFNVFTGLPIFHSDVVAGWVYYADAAPADGFTVWQALPGTDVRLAWGYRL